MLFFLRSSIIGHQYLFLGEGTMKTRATDITEMLNTSMEEARSGEGISWGKDDYTDFSVAIVALDDFGRDLESDGRTFRSIYQKLKHGGPQLEDKKEQILHDLNYCLGRMQEIQDKADIVVQEVEEAIEAVEKTAAFSRLNQEED
jgi:hypothetical protein